MLHEKPCWKQLKPDQSSKSRNMPRPRKYLKKKKKWSFCTSAGAIGTSAAGGLGWLSSHKTWHGWGHASRSLLSGWFALSHPDRTGHAGGHPGPAQGASYTRDARRTLGGHGHARGWCGPYKRSSPFSYRAKALHNFSKCETAQSHNNTPAYEGSYTFATIRMFHGGREESKNRKEVEEEKKR